MFGVTLIKIDKTKNNVLQMEEAKTECSHIVNDFYVFEGDLWFVGFDHTEVSTGVCDCLGGLSTEEKIKMLDDYNGWGGILSQ